MSRILALASIALQTVIGNRCDTKVALAATGGATATIASTGTISFVIGGLHYTKAALSAQSFVPTHDWQGKPVATGAVMGSLPIGKTAYFVVALNATGTVAIVQGSYAGQSIANAADLSKRETGTGDLPVEPDGYTAIGYVKIVNGSVGVFNPGVTLLNVAGITQTYVDCERLPATAA